MDKLTAREQLEILDFREGRLNDEPEKFECHRCKEIVEEDGENSSLHKLCWMCLEDYY